VTITDGNTSGTFTITTIPVVSSSSVTISAEYAGVTRTANLTVTPVVVTIQTSPLGRSFTVDGTTYSSAQTFNWSRGSSHTIATTSPQSGAAGTQYVWSNWSDTGVMSHSVAPTANTTYTANFTTQYYLTMSAGTGGSVTPPSGWFNSAQTVQIQATANSGNAFTSWTGSGTGSYTGTNNPVNVTMNAPITQTAAFKEVVQVTVQTSPAGRSFSVDGAPYTSAQTFTWDRGSNHTIATTSPQSGAAGTRYAWSSWSDTGVISHSVSPTANTTYTANFTTQYYLTMNAGTGGSVTPTSNWYNSGQSVQIQAIPNSGYAFMGWTGSGTGSYTGTSNPVSVTMNAPIAETPIFSQPRLHGDFNADGKADILWRNTATGDINVWFLNGVTVIADGWLPRVTDQQWQVAGIGDLNGDGKPDLVWRHTVSGDINVWFMNGVSLISDAWLPRVADLHWKIAAVGDLNGDTKADIFWRNTTTGDINVWFMNGAAITGDIWLPRVTDQQWQIAGVGDFNRDFRADVVWRHAVTGDINVWLMNGTTVTGDVWLPRVINQQWQIFAIADSNGNGCSDIIWRHTVTGDINVWFMDGATVVSDGWLPRVWNQQWQIVGPR
jgi:hypothetical protein